MCQVMWCSLSFSLLSPSPLCSPFKILFYFLSSNVSCSTPGVIALHYTVDLRQIRDWGGLTAVSVMRHLWQDSDREVGGQSASQTLQAVNIVVVYLCFHRMQSLVGLLHCRWSLSNILNLKILQAIQNNVKVLLWGISFDYSANSFKKFIDLNSKISVLNLLIKLKKQWN